MTNNIEVENTRKVFSITVIYYEYPFYLYSAISSERGHKVQTVIRSLIQTILILNYLGFCTGYTADQQLLLDDPVKLHL